MVYTMPWKKRSIVEERMRFVLRLKDGESMAGLCREFGISRVTGYKVYERYKECGLEGLTDRAITPYRYANTLPAQLEAMIVAMRRERPTWGARKLRTRLSRCGTRPTSTSPRCALRGIGELSLIPSMIEPNWSLAARFVFFARKSISALFWRVRRWA